MKISAVITCIIGAFLIFIGVLIFLVQIDGLLTPYFFFAYGIAIPPEIWVILAAISLISGTIFLLGGLILGLIRIPKFVKEVLGEAEDKKEKEDYKDLNWLKYQYYDLERTIQDIADEQNVNMITIRKWIDKLENK